MADLLPTRGIVSRCAAVLVFATVFSFFAPCRDVRAADPNTGADATSPTVAVPLVPEQKSMLMQMQDAFTKIAKNAEPWVVNIKSEHSFDSTDTSAAPGPHAAPPSTPGGGDDTSPFPRREEATGSGEIVRADGYILTNDHVVEGSSFVTVTLSDGREFVGSVARDRSSDLAVVKIDAKESLPYATFADSDKVAPGQWAIAIGSPFDLQNTLTVGLISATKRHQLIGDNPSSARYYADLLQTDAAINPGNSGGPLLNVDGQIVGINVAIESPVEGNAGVGFAIPANIAIHVMENLIKNGKVVRGFLGLAPADLTPAREAEYGVQSGAWVLQVDKDSPAGRAGIHAADIITSFDGKPIDGELSLRLAISGTAPGATVPIELLHDGKSVSVTATVASPPPPTGSDTGTDNGELPKAAPQRKIGVSVRTVAPEDRQSLGLDPSVAGAYVTNVLSNSPAESAGIEENDVITSINRMPVTSAEGAAKILGGLNPGDQVTVIVTRSSHGGRIQEIALDLKI